MMSEGATWEYYIVEESEKKNDITVNQSCQVY